MVRRVIWFQVLLLIIAAIATLADRGIIPRYLFPSEGLLNVCYLFSLVLPIVVVITSLCKPRLWAFVELATSMAILAATVFALLPAVQ